MAVISPDALQKLSGIQNQIWQTVSLTSSETADMALNFANPQTNDVPTSDLYTEMSEPKLVIQFSFSDMPENSQILLIPQDTLIGLAASLKDEKVDEIDENLISEIRPTLEALVQGICVAVGNLRDEAIVASGLSIRFQIFSFPPNMNNVDSLIQTTLTFSGSEFGGDISWLIDVLTAHMILGIEPTEDETDSEDSTDGEASSHASPEENLEILMDIPLQISVELGRVKMVVKDVLELGSGSIIEIDKAAGEPVDVMVNGHIVARGEVVVIEDNFGVRITEILSQQDRLSKLNEVA
ncbi:MAG: flagellar motor switch protein FliN [Armatimonadetes bacterium]|nr:flagellar motor switch protein FliN [Armatimonadota bacterium]